MSTYIIGDVHGHFRTLRALLDVIEFNEKKDTIYLTGDLVNGGKHSARVVRWARDNAKPVLGNHDLHLLAVWYGDKKQRKKDTFHDLFDAPDADELVEWLRQQPLLRVRDTFAIAHAGIYPKWGLKKAQRRAKEAEALYQGKNPGKWFAQMYGNEPKTRKSAENDVERFRFAINAFTRMRTVTANMELDLSYSGSLARLPEDLTPWFQAREQGWKHRVYFGHWAALALHLNDKVAALDSGVRWGGPLTAHRLEDGALFQHPRV